MITGILAAVAGLASANMGGLIAGSAVGAGLEVALPWVTRATRARRAIRIFRRLPGGPRLNAVQERRLRETI